MHRFWLFAVVALAVGCKEKAPEAGFRDRQPCNADTDCDEGWICDDQECARLCNVSSECPTADQECEDGVCTPVANPDCRQASDCPPPGQCYVVTVAPECVGGRCTYQRQPVGTPCSDGDACTVSDSCNAESNCVGVTRICDDPPDNRCDGNTFVSYPSDGVCNASTGECDYVPQTSDCGPDCPGTCLARCAGVICADYNGGCRGNGVCVPTDPATCDYDIAPDGARCDRPGEPVGSQLGFCTGGLCGDCSRDEDCTNPPTAFAACFDPSCDSGVCSYSVLLGATCAAASCVDNYQTNARTCDASGDCPDAGGSDCDGYACAGNVCGTAPCDGNEDCANGYYCNGSSCDLMLGVGEPCVTGGPPTCSGGLKCSNDVCCDESGPPCCDGVDDDCDGLACNTSVFSCLVSCTDYEVAQCVDPDNTYCLGDACVAKLSDGEECDYDVECEHEQCVEGVCCESACDATCASCRLALTGEDDGVCATIDAGLADTAPTALCTAVGGVGCDADSCACDGGGTSAANCKRGTGQPCTVVGDCASAACECADTSCTELMCVPDFCEVCEYTTTGSNCVSGLGSPSEVDDPPDCQGPSSCYDGVCLLDVGELCTDDAACGSDACECGDAACTTNATRCAVAACPECTFTENGTACDRYLDPGVVCDDGNGSTTGETCNGAGVCEVQCDSTPVVYSTAGTDTWVVPPGCSLARVKAWGAGGGGGGGADDGDGGAGGAGGFVQADVVVTPSESLDVFVGGGGGGGSLHSGTGWGGGGGGGYSGLVRSGSPLLIAAGGGGGGGGDNGSSPPLHGGAGGAGGGETGFAGADGGVDGGNPMAGGGGGTQSAGGSAEGSAGPGSALQGGGGGNADNMGAGGGVGFGGTNGGGTGGSTTASRGGGGGGGAGTFGGGGGAGVDRPDASAAGGGGGSSSVSGDNSHNQAGSGADPANVSDADYISGVGVGGEGGEASNIGEDPIRDGEPGGDGLVVIAPGTFFIELVDQIDAPLASVTESNIVALVGLLTAQLVTISGDGNPAFRICNDSACSSVDHAWGDVAQTIDSGQYLQLRLTSASSEATVHSATVVIGSASEQWNVTSWAPAPDLQFLEGDADANFTTVYTYNNINFGASAADRLIIVGVLGLGSASLESVTVGGVPATQVPDSAWWTALVPSGSFGDVRLTYASPKNSCGIGVWRLTGYQSATPYHVAKHNQGDAVVSTSTIDLDIPGQGVAVFVQRVAGSGPLNWSAASQRYYRTASDGGDWSGADYTPSSGDEFPHTEVTTYPSGPWSTLTGTSWR